MPENRTCVDCGDSYVFDKSNKRGASTRCCATCVRRNAKHETKRLMFKAAGGECRCCGYKKCLDAITFVDPIERLSPEKSPVNRDEKIAWAASKIALCLNCVAEVNGKYVKMHIEDSRARPVKVFFATDIATMVDKVRPKTVEDTTVALHKGPVVEAHVEVLPPERK